MTGKKYYSFTLIGCCFFLIPHSQNLAKKTAVVQYQGNVQSGFLFGQSGSKPALDVAIINGVKISQWFAGVGFGIDYYGTKRSLPLFATVERELSKKANSFFLLGSAGYNIPWLKGSQKVPYVNNYKQTGGLFYEAGVGYKFIAFKKSHLGLSAAYSFKQVKEKYSEPCYWCENDIPPTNDYNYKFRRIAVKLNWWFL